jgi:hypothetical protein
LGIQRLLPFRRASCLRDAGEDRSAFTGFRRDRRDACPTFGQVGRATQTREGYIDDALANLHKAAQGWELKKLLSMLKVQMRATPKTRLQILGTGILAVGLGVAAWIWLAQADIDGADAAGAGGPLTTLDSRKQVRQLEIYYGESGVLLEEFKAWLASLAHGKRLAATVAVGSCLLGGGCFLAAGWLLPRLERARLNAGAG